VPSEHGELLLVHKTDNDLWALPGGAMDVGESIAQTVVREVKEETGIEVEVTGVVGIYTDQTT
jgi:ADP-ribose pyrophosphatase YjhB (NUDIX family)